MCQPVAATLLQPRREREQLWGQSDRIDQDERLQFHLSVVSCQWSVVRAFRAIDRYYLNRSHSPSTWAPSPSDQLALHCTTDN